MEVEYIFTLQRKFLNDLCANLQKFKLNHTYITIHFDKCDEGGVRAGPGGGGW